ncbi:GntR family transcriptional regulator [Streptococcus caprae]|uniref:GntR family transcriptional regulator n=1 Tax=Streptococcus caprae TaxID=1640501 RepID=A0ABV8CUP2_9STRE
MAIPKYQEVANAIREKIITQEYLVGEVIPTEAKLQEIYSVSRHTVRQALNVLNNEGYVRSEKGSGTYVLNRLENLNISSGPATKKIGVITTYLSDYIFPTIIRGVEEVLRQNGYSLVLASTNNDIVQEEICLKNMLEEGIDGLIVEPTKSNLYNPNIQYYLQFRELGIPVLFINAYYELLDFPYIAMDDSRAGEAATQHLIDEGCRQIGLFTKVDDLQGKLRMKGYISALENAHFPLVSERLFTYTTETEQEVLGKLYEILSKNPQTLDGLVCYNDLMALKIKQLIPQEHLPKLVSHDNSILAVAASLSSVNHPKEELGKRAAQKMVDTLESQKQLTTEVIKVSL